MDKHLTARMFFRAFMHCALTGADDRSTGQGWQTRKRRVGWRVKYGWKSFSQKLSPFDGRKEWCLLGDERVDKIEVSKVSDKHPVGVPKSAGASKDSEEAAESAGQTEAVPEEYGQVG